VGLTRKIKAGLVKVSVNDFIGEDGNVFFDIDDGVMRLSDGVTPGGTPLSSGGGEGGASTFRQLLDTPSSFSGHGGKYLKVNAQASQIEFVDETPFDGDYDSLTNTPTLFNPSNITSNLVPSTTETIDLGSTSKKFRDLYLSGNTIFLGEVQISRNAEGGVDLPTGSRIGGAAIATGSGGTTNYNDLTGKPTIPVDVSDLTDTGSLLGGGGGGTTNYNLLTNLPDLTVYQLAANAFSGDYDDLNNKPALFSGSYTDLSDKPTLFSGSYTDLSDKPTLFSGAYADLTGKPTLFSGAYADLTSKPTTLSGYGITDAATSAQGALADSALQSFTVTQGMVTAHEAALSITESQISDLQSYLTAVSEAQVTAHQAALSITESQISNFGTYLTTVAFADLTSKPTTLSGYGITDAATATQGALADTALQSFTETNDLTAAVVWANVPDANITQSSVTQHQASLSVTESQISDLQSYLTSVAFADLTTTPTTVAGYGITDVYTKTETDSAVSTAVSNLVGDAPAVLDTLSELADAIGDDANFLTTLNSNIALKANTADLAIVATSGSYNDLANQPDVADLDDAQGLLAAAGGISEDEAIIISMLFG
jgi:hypothetical protein